MNDKKERERKIGYKGHQRKWLVTIRGFGNQNIYFNVSCFGI